jgi:Domain of unknown function (DUF4157)
VVASVERGAAAVTEKAHQSQHNSAKSAQRSSAPARADRWGGGLQPVTAGVGESAGVARSVLRLQRQVGNQAVGRWLGAEQPHDGDRSTTVEDRGPVVGGNGNDLPRLLAAQAGPGHGLPPDAREDVEAGVGVPLEDVRVHTDGGGEPKADPTPHNVQMELTVGSSDDPLEQEADRAAAGAASGSAIHAGSAAAPAVSRASFGSAGGQVGNASLNTRIKSTSGGRPLPDPLRDEMQTMFNADFSAVRVHDSEQDRTDAESLGAQAFTHKQDIWLGQDGIANDRGLMAHELTHVLQQGTDIRRKPIDQRPAVDKPFAGPQLPPGRNYEWHRKGMVFLVLLSKQWLLDRGVPPETVKITDAAVMKELLLGVKEAAPWADITALEKHKAFSELDLPGKLADQPDTIILPVRDLPTEVIGNPPGEEVVIRASPKGADIWVDTTLIRRSIKTPAATEIVNAAFTAQVFGILETVLNQAMGAGREAGWRTALYADYMWTLPRPADTLERSAHFELTAPELADLFGPDWMAKATAGAAKEAGRVKDATISLPASLKDDWPQIMAVLKEIAGAAKGPKKDETNLAISERDALLLVKIAKSPLRSQIIARLKTPTEGAKKSTSLGDVLETVIEEMELKDARTRLHLGDPGVSDEQPVLNRPVHGDIVLTGGRPVPDKEAVFTFQTKDDVDALRAPLIQIQWVVYAKDKPKLIFDAELNTYSPLRSQGPINDKLFEVTFPRAGTYVVEAIVNHNFYRTAHFSTEVKVLTEQQEAEYQEKTALAGFAAPTGAKTVKHDFDVGGVTSTLTDYEKGTITRGKLDPKFKTGTFADRLKGIDAEIARVEKLFKQYETRPGEQAAAVRNWAEDYLKTLREGRTKVEADAKDTRLIPCTGVYVSRSKKAPSKALDLVCLQKRTADGGYHVVVHDLSQVYENENYVTDVDNDTAEGAYEEVFVELSELYPDGTLSVAFQGWDEKAQAPTDSYVKFRKVTDTIGKDIKTTVFDPAVNIAVNIAAAVMMVVPGLQAAGFALAIIWNTSQTITELEEKASKGTLKDKDFVYAGAQFALDLIPVAGRSSRMVSLGRKAYYVIEGVQLAGQVVLITAQGLDQIEKVRNGVISRLAKVNQEIEELERINPSEPKLEVLRGQQEELIKEGQDAVIETYGSIVAQQAVMMVGGHVIQQAAIKKFGARISELEAKGRFVHVDGETPRYDYTERRIVGDRQAMTEAQFEKAERTAVLSERLEGALSDPALREKVIEILGDGPVEVVVGGNKTHLQSDGDKKVLHIAEGARPDEILTAAHGSDIPARTSGTVDDPEAKPSTPAPAGPGSQFGLDEARTKKLLDAVTPEQAQMLHDFLGESGLKRLTDSHAGTIKSLADGIERAKLAATEPLAAEGLARMGSKQYAKDHPMSPSTVADILATVPPGRMELFLRVVGDPAMPHPRQLGADGLKRLAGSSDTLGFIGEHGGAAYGELRKEKAFGPLLEKLRGLEPDEAHALVEKVRAAKTPTAKLAAVDIEPPTRRPRVATGRVAANKNLPGWDKHLERAQQFAKEHRNHLDRTGKPYDPTPEQIEMLAAMYQLRETARSSTRLPHDKRVRMLDEFDQLGRDAGLQTQWINNLRGGLSESLFSPSGGRNKTRLEHPAGGFTILDYAFEPGARAGSKTGRKEWVEQKSDLITAPPGSDAVYGPAVGRAKRYAQEAALDMKAINHNPATKGDTILIDFVRSPGNDATRKAMLDTLFSETSPIQAVKFADGPWIERADYLAGK